MKPLHKIGAALGTGALSLIVSAQAWAQEVAEDVAEAAPPVAEAAAEVAAVVDKGDTAWMMMSTVLVMAMIVPGLALFYGGLVRTKNMLSVLTQILAVASLAMIIWVIYGYSTAFGPEGNAFVSWGNLFLANTNADSTAATFSDGFLIPEYVFIAFQMTFAAITVALVVGGLV